MLKRTDGNTMNKQKIPKTLVAGYPEKVFHFSGQYERVILKSQRGSRVARRNRKTVYYPVYKSDDGETFLFVSEIFSQTDRESV
jgi:hypothetical protein